MIAKPVYFQSDGQFGWGVRVGCGQNPIIIHYRMVDTSPTYCLQCNLNTQFGCAARPGNSRFCGRIIDTGDLPNDVRCHFNQMVELHDKMVDKFGLGLI